MSFYCGLTYKNVGDDNGDHGNKNQGGVYLLTLCFLLALKSTENVFDVNHSLRSLTINQGKIICSFRQNYIEREEEQKKNCTNVDLHHLP